MGEFKGVVQTKLVMALGLDRSTQSQVQCIKSSCNGVHHLHAHREAYSSTKSPDTKKANTCDLAEMNKPQQQ